MLIKQPLFNVSTFLSPGQTLRVNADFAYDLLSTECIEQALEAIITRAMSDIPCACDGASTMVCLG